jgi:putative tryptophan/tyrosine transport system substrate-binding protein
MPFVVISLFTTTVRVIHSQTVCVIRKVGVLSILFVVALLDVAVIAEAQAQAKVSKIGWLSARPASKISGQEVIVRMLRDLGYIEGKNIAYEYRYANNKLDRFPALADELVRLKVDVLLTPGTPGALALKNATKTIPIVFTDVTDPVAAGLVARLARPGETSRGSAA